MKIIKSGFLGGLILALAACASKHTSEDSSATSGGAGKSGGNQTFYNQHNYRYPDLIIKDYDEMYRQVQARIVKAHKAAAAATKNGDEAGADHAAIEELRDALKFIFSRPNSDNMVAKLVPDIRRDLSDMAAYEDTMSSLAAEEIGIIQDNEATTIQRSTALFVLENLLGEIKPEIGSNPEFRRIAQRIADADLEIGHDVINDRKLRSMYMTKNPSDEAKEILKKLDKAEKDKKKN